MDTFWRVRLAVEFRRVRLYVVGVTIVRMQNKNSLIRISTLAERAARSGGQRRGKGQAARAGGRAGGQGRGKGPPRNPRINWLSVENSQVLQKLVPNSRVIELYIDFGGTPGS